MTGYGIRLSAALILMLAAASARADDFFFKDGDTIVIIGDSITEQHLYSNYVEMWTVSRFPAWKLTFRNVGIGGDRSTGGQGRFQRDVVAFKPTAMTVDFGMNDGNYRAFDDKGFKTYMGGLQKMADQAKAAGIRVAWVTPQPVENVNDPGFEKYNDTLEKYSAGVQEIAAKNQGLFVDQYHPYFTVMEKARQKNPKAHIGGGDAVHPGPAGQALMAAAILRGLHLPTRVSAVEIDAGSRKGTGKHATVTDVEAANGGVRFKRLDAALPFYPAEAKGLLAHAPILDELNEYLLTVKGLNSGKYEVKLGGKKVAEYSAEELAKGVNLAGPALSAGPVADQVNAIWKAVQAKNKYYHDRIFRGIVLTNPSIPDWLDLKLTQKDIDAKRKAAIAERLTKLPELDAEVRKLLPIQAHEVAVVPVK